MAIDVAFEAELNQGVAWDLNFLRKCELSVVMRRLFAGDRYRGDGHADGFDDGKR